MNNSKTPRPGKQWQSPSFLIWLLSEQINSLKNSFHKTDDDEFDHNFKEDMVLRKNIELELRDIKKVTTCLSSLINQ